MLADIRFALRQLARAPGFTAIALITLAVGMGSATVVFSSLNALLYKPLPLLDYPEDRLVQATEVNRAQGLEDLGWNYPDYLAVRERATTLAGIWIHADRTVLIRGGEKPERLLGTDISWDAFGVMGVAPRQGRNFAATDVAPGAGNVALISASLWKKRFGAKRDVVGSTVTLNGQPTTIIGVMPPGWRYPDYTDVWTPLQPNAEKPPARGYYSYSGRARLKSGVTRAQAQAEVDGILAAIAREFPVTNRGVGARLNPLRAQALQQVQNLTWLLAGAVACVFLIACVNVANLLLARAVTRSKEMAIRMALGAGRARVVRQLVSESIVLGLLGGAAGLVLGLWGNDAMVALMPIEIPFWLRFEFDLRVFGFVLFLSLVAALVFGLVPAWRTSHPDLVNELKDGGRSVETSGPKATRLRSALVVAEIALALVLLVGAGLMMRSFIQLRRTDPGFTPRGLLTFRTGFPMGLVGEDKTEPRRFFDELLRRLEAVPGVESSALMSWRPSKDDGGGITAFQIPGRPPPATLADALLAQHRLVSPGFFKTMQIPVRAGRVFDDAIDREDAPKVAVVDEAFAVRHFGSAAAALGQRLAAFDEQAAAVESAQPDEKVRTPVEIVGVVGTVRHRLDQPDPQPTLYVSRRQYMELFLTAVVRTSGDPAALVEAARQTVMAVNREIPIYEEGPLEAALLRGDTVWPRRFFSYLFVVFGLIALFLACIGIYGVMAYNVTQRVQELGVRLALGAQPGAVIGFMVRKGVYLIAAGLGIGLIAALGLARLLAGVLYGVSPHDPPTFTVVPLLLAAVALLACWLPSRRATLIEPNAALRAE
jgi:putative ABC transport system permease protein